MTTSELEGRSPQPPARRTPAAAPSAAGSSAGGKPEAGAGGDRPPAPARPSLAQKAAAPVIVRIPAPISVRLSQLFWALSLLVGAVAVVYLFVIRDSVLPEMTELIKGVDATRAEETYTTASDILYWTGFGSLVAVLLVEVTVLVSFSNRRRGARWWMLGMLAFQAVAFLAIRELIALGDRAVPLERVLLLQLALAAFALLVSTLPGALRWTARQHDVRRGEPVGSRGDL